ncbi:MAG: LysM domain-containing protein [Candidatus Gastranaerophilales bacterium]|nr:LysM domain-containing protein [Candidatus Gastranaerophilales bacterium]
MKNSTLNRSTLSPEKMHVLAELRAAQRKQAQDGTPGIYKRPSKQKELDILWQSFKLNQKEEKSPGIYLLAGFIAGALCMFLMTAALSISADNSDNLSNDSIATPKVEKRLVKKQKASKLAIVPPDKPAEETAVASSSEQYTVQNGDTLESIIIRFYGKYDPSKVEKIKHANGLANPNAISIGQKLTIPMD